VGRPAKFTAEQMLDAAADVVAEAGAGAATVAAVAARLGAPAGSIYHRFESRDLLLAKLWARTVHRAQAGFVEALRAPYIRDAAHGAAVHIPRWARTHLDEARVLVLHRREDLLARWPAELGAELVTLNDGVRRALEEFARRQFGHATKSNVELVTFALVDIPYGGVRRHLLAGVAPPAAVDEYVVRACDGVFGW
jgi:AcrR family transcriptional regulator